MRNHFCSVHIIGEYEEKKIPILLISNHISWWDGFWAMYLNLKLFKRKFHFMMLEEHLRKHWFFNYTGGYSVNKKSKSILETLNYTTELLKNKNNMVLIFPQGKLQSQHNQAFQFENGIEHILKRMANNVQIIFSANLVDYFSKPKPSLYMYIQEFNVENYSTETLQSLYNEFYRKCIQKQVQSTH